MSPTRDCRPTRDVRVRSLLGHRLAGRARERDLQRPEDLPGRLRQGVQQLLCYERCFRRHCRRLCDRGAGYNRGHCEKIVLRLNNINFSRFD